MNLLASYFQKIRSLLKDKAFEKSVVTAGVKEIIKIDIPEDYYLLFYFTVTFIFLTGIGFAADKIIEIFRHSKRRTAAR